MLTRLPFSSLQGLPTSGAADWQEHVAPDGRRYVSDERCRPIVIPLNVLDGHAYV